MAQWSRDQALDTKQQIIDQFSARHWLENVSLFLCYSSLICQKKKKKKKRGRKVKGKEERKRTGKKLLITPKFMGNSRLSTTIE